MRRTYGLFAAAVLAAAAFAIPPPASANCTGPPAPIVATVAPHAFTTGKAIIRLDPSAIEQYIIAGTIIGNGNRLASKITANGDTVASTAHDRTALEVGALCENVAA